MEENWDEKLKGIKEKYPLAPYTGRSCLVTTIRRMKAAESAEIPVNLRRGIAISVKTGKRTHEMEEEEWKDIYGGLMEELKRKYPDEYQSLFLDGVAS